jgi:hypothetical protein
MCVFNALSLAFSAQCAAMIISDFAVPCIVAHALAMPVFVVGVLLVFARVALLVLQVRHCG